jgi:hypothetical protein
MVAAALGGGYATWLRIRRPHVLTLVGHGANAALAPVTLPSPVVGVA